MMNWIKRNWLVVLIVSLHVAFLAQMFGPWWPRYGQSMTAHAQKPCEGCNWRGETREEYCKTNPNGLYSEGNGDAATPCATLYLIPKAQKPEPRYYFDPNPYDQRPGEWSARDLRIYVEQHCRPVKDAIKCDK